MIVKALDIRHMTIAAAISFTALWAYVDKYMFSDFERLHVLVLIMLLDFCTGVTRSWVQGREITSKGFRESIGKVVQYGAFLIVTQLLVSIHVAGEVIKSVGIANPETLITFSYMVLIITEIKSVYENITGINPKLDIVGKLSKRLAELAGKTLRK